MDKVSIEETLDEDSYDFSDWKPLPSAVIPCELAGVQDADWTLEEDELPY